MARADNTSHFKSAIVSWMVEMFGASDLPLQVWTKDECGFTNEHTGQLLCPTGYSWNDPV
jgi:hypothetical protein